MVCNKFNLSMVTENDLSLNDLVLLSYLELKINKYGINGEYSISYDKIIKDLPLIFNAKANTTNLARLRTSLNKEGFQNFITREIIQEGRSKGAKIIFRANQNNLDLLGVKGIVGEE